MESLYKSHYFFDDLLLLLSTVVSVIVLSLAHLSTLCLPLA